ncbi:hypothetical protein RhiXN_09263 [Rhizoctonia solani]|uniref:Uncharacterized protein n=1 Tax=Rhizoctonia solani TaxID=456999 RepID=A0A8H8NXS7_9AGAM|nr:uncharacterized protein RhiXN_09263 [Rhizoctonia solani]QRW20288.1 hypothetical protein RhiXN_09263 [Rhizoctonia solani]
MTLRPISSGVPFPPPSKLNHRSRICQLTPNFTHNSSAWCVPSKSASNSGGMTSWFGDGGGGWYTTVLILSDRSGLARAIWLCCVGVVRGARGARGLVLNAVVAPELVVVVDSVTPDAAATLLNSALADGRVVGGLREALRVPMLALSIPPLPPDPARIVPTLAPSSPWEL